MRLMWSSRGAHRGVLIARCLSYRHHNYRLTRIHNKLTTCTYGMSIIYDMLFYVDFLSTPKHPPYSAAPAVPAVSAIPVLWYHRAVFMTAASWHKTEFRHRSHLTPCAVVHRVFAPCSLARPFTCPLPVRHTLPFSFLSSTFYVFPLVFNSNASAS